MTIKEFRLKQFRGAKIHDVILHLERMIEIEKKIGSEYAEGRVEGMKIAVALMKSNLGMEEEKVV